MLTRPVSHLLIALLTLGLWFAFAPHKGWAGPLTQASQVYLPVINGSDNPPTPTPTQGAGTAASPTTTPTSAPVTATPVPPTPTPLTPTPESPYDARLTQALTHCAAITANQTCLANGAAAGFAQVGMTLDITQPVTLSVRSALSNSSVLDLANWSVLLIRLQAPGDETITQTLDLIAVGNVDVAVRQLFTSTEVAPGVPVVQVSSQPLQNGTQPAPSGLILRNRTISELLSIEVNQAAITLDGAAFVQTQPPAGLQTSIMQSGVTQSDAKMTVAVPAGSALVQVADAASTVIAGSQVQAQLDAQGKANGAPSSAAEFDESLLIPLDIDGLLVPLTREEQVEQMRLRLVSAMITCSFKRNPPSVYRAFYYLRQLQTPANRSFISQAQWDTLARDFKKCARFEVIFDSTITGSTSLTWRDQVHSDGTFIQFDVNGELVAEASSPLKHLGVEMSVPVCQLQSIAKPDGTFAVKAASLRIYYNTMKVAMKTFPYMTLEQIPTGTFICPQPSPPLVVPIEWNTMFIQLHPELWLPQPIYLLREEHWKYTGRQIFAEAIFADRSAPFADGMIASDSYFILRHAPVE